MSYTQFRTGYLKETTPGTSIITAVGDTTYKLGAISEKSNHPSPVAFTNYISTGYNVKEVGAGGMWKDYYVVMGTYGFIFQNGVPCWMAMGTSSTGAGPPYTHAIGPTTDGAAIPSFTINHEQKGSATDEEYQFMGCKVDSLAMTYDMAGAPFLMGIMEVRGLKAQDGIALTNDPVLPPTANTDAYVQLERKWNTGGTNLDIDGLQKVTINIANGLEPKYGRTWSAGTYTGMWPFQLLEANRKQYRVEMLLHPKTVEREMWDSLISTTTAITCTFKFIRSATDYILVTVVGPIVEHELITPDAGESLLEKVVIEPYDLNIEVKDSITGTTYYGE